VEILIGALAEPENDTYRIEVDGQKISLKTYFETLLREQHDRRVNDIK
jgi:hypothetical protein